MQYSYYAVFEYTEDGINIRFPDLDALSCAADTETGLAMAEEALALSLHGRQLTYLPAPSGAEDLVLAPNEKVFRICAELECRDKRLFSEGVEEFVEDIVF